MTLTAAEATALLGVKPATLYAYVSRGLIRSEHGPNGTRQRLYNAQDVHALLKKQSWRRDPDRALDGAVQDAVSSALHWGTPILDSALTSITQDQLTYRGHDALHLAQTATVENIAALLWTGDLHGWRDLPLKARLNLSAHPQATRPVEAFGYALTHAGTHDLTALDFRPDTLPAQAARTLNLLYATLERHSGIPSAPDLPLHQRLARTWGARQHGEVLRQALVLLADHELNVSAFTARVTASGGASLHHTVLAALCALQGIRHGLAALAAHDLLSQALREGVHSALRDSTRRHAGPPGFGHPLYPAGDPRARSLLTTLAAESPTSPAVTVMLELTDLVRTETGDLPNVDLALATLVHVLSRPADDALALFALARSVGWLGHAIETLSAGQMIRPRARFVGSASHAAEAQ